MSFHQAGTFHLSQDFVDGVCTGCVLGKHPQDTFDKGKSWRASRSSSTCSQ
jgi:hypothetical protein